MRWLVALLVALVPFVASGQNCNTTGCPLLVGIYAFAGLPAPAACPSCMAVVNNSSATTTCDGAGATFALCRSNGAAWQAIAGGAGGGGDNISVNTVAAADADFTNGDIDWTRTPGPPDLITATVGCTACVSYAEVQNVTATSRFLGRISGGAGVMEELNGTQATTLLDAFTDVLKGVAPASGGGTTNFLRADGTWVAPAGGSGLTYAQVAAAVMGGF